MRKSLWVWVVLTLLLAVGHVAAESLGSGGYYGLIEAGAAFTGDLSGNDLSDSSDNVVTSTDPVVVTGTFATTCVATTLGAAETTFAATSNCHVVTGDAGANTLATITGGTDGQYLYIQWVDALVTVTDTDAHTANTIDLEAAFTSADDSALLLWFDGTSWYETSRSPVAASFDGDLATDTALQDSSDSAIDIAAGNDICWTPDAEGCIESHGDGLFTIKNAAGSAATGRLCFGDPTNVATSCIDGATSNVATLVGATTGNAEDTFRSLAFEAIQSGNPLVTIDQDQIELEEGHNGGGFIGWNSTNGSTGVNVNFACFDNGAQEHTCGVFNSTASISVAGTPHGSVKIGDTTATTADLSDCDQSLDGTPTSKGIETNSVGEPVVCSASYDGTSETFKWKAGGAFSHWYITHGNATVTDITGSGTWDRICGKTSTACDTQIWNVGVENGFDLQSDDSIDVVGKWSTEAAEDRLFWVTYSVSFSGSASTAYMFTIQKSDTSAGPATVQEDCYARRNLGSTDIGSLSATCAVLIDVEDSGADTQLELVVQQTSGSTADITVQEANITIRGS